MVVGVMMGSMAKAQITTQSPYSRYGIGNPRGSYLPQQRAMGGIGAGVGKSTYFNNINMQNPASYATLGLTSLDIGLAGSYIQLRTSSNTESSLNASLSHVAMAFPVSRKSAFSIGITPYSDLGYNFKIAESIGTGSNAKPVDYLYTGEGGLSRAYLGYGFQLGDHLRLGANATYIFGNMIQNTAVELSQDQTSSLNNKTQVKNTVGGIAFDYGAQYQFRLDSKTNLTLGYSGSSSSALNTKTTAVVTQYTRDESGNESQAKDTLFFAEGLQNKLKLPLLHTFGFVVQKDNRWLVGADYRTGKWSKLTIANQNQGLQDTWGVSVGGQFTPDFSAISGYFKTVDYRLGFAYDKTHIQLAGQDIKQMAVTIGAGFPLKSFGRTSFYKINVAAELGQRGQIANGLLQERYVNFHLGFTLNDRWFQRFRFD